MLRRRRRYIVCFLGLELLATLPLLAQQDTSASLFASKQYPAYLVASEKPITDLSVAQLPKAFLWQLQMAIAIDRAKMQNDPVAQRITAAIQKSPDAARWFAAVQKVLVNDWTGVPSFFNGNAPAIEDWWRTPPLLKEHGYEMPARLFSALIVLGPMRNAEMMRQPLTDWLSFDGKAREFLDKFLQPYLDKDPMKLRELCRLAFQMYQQRTGKDAAPYFDLALQMGKQIGFATPDLAEQLPTERGEDALRVLRAYASQHPTEVQAQMRAAEVCLRKAGYAEALRLCAEGLKTVPDPFAADLRLDYCNYLVWSNNPEALAAAQKAPDPLVTATLSLSQKQYAQAAALFKSAIGNQNSAIASRLAAWAGLLKSDPKAALEIAPALVKELPPPQPGKEGALATELRRWMGRQVWRQVDVLAPLGQTMYGAPRTYRPLTEAGKDWTARASALLATLIKDEPRTLPGLEGLRLPTACLYALNGESERVTEVLRQEVTYELYPPESGWKMPDIRPQTLRPGGAPEAPAGNAAAAPKQPPAAKPVKDDRFQPRVYVSPQPGEEARLRQQVTEFVARFAASPYAAARPGAVAPP